MNDDDKYPEFRPSNRPTLLFGEEVLNGDIHWRNTLLELLRFSTYNLDNITELLKCQHEALLRIINHNDPSLLGFKQGTRLVSLHDRALRGKKLLLR